VPPAQDSGLGRTTRCSAKQAEQWLVDYNNEIPHGGLGSLTPVEFRVQSDPTTCNLVWH
jgi:putative transposase